MQTALNDEWIKANGKRAVRAFFGTWEGGNR